jgi:uracil-DNA glycosylase family 4
MCGRTKVLSEKNGNIDSKVMFIAEAPGRLGAERTGIPLHGDKTGDNFEDLLKSIGWERKNVFITNAILCNPQNDEGNNATPEPEELSKCGNYLKRTIELVNPDVIVTLGGTALKTLTSQSLTLSEYAAQELSWNDRVLFPLYHPSNRAKRFRKKEKQMADFAALKRIVDSIVP